jgi:hypothetical protein
MGSKKKRSVTPFVHTGSLVALKGLRELETVLMKF